MQNRIFSTRLYIATCGLSGCTGQLKCDGTRAETRFRLSAKRTSPFKWAEGRQFSRLLAAEVCASAVVMLDTPCSEVVWSATGYPLHSPVSPSIPPPVRHRVPSRFNWSLPICAASYLRRRNSFSTQRKAQIPSCKLIRFEGIYRCRNNN